MGWSRVTAAVIVENCPKLRAHVARQTPPHSLASLARSAGDIMLFASPCAARNLGNSPQSLLLFRAGYIFPEFGWHTHTHTHIPTQDTDNAAKHTDNATQYTYNATHYT